MRKPVLWRFEERILSSLPGALAAGQATLPFSAQPLELLSGLETGQGRCQ